MSISRSLQHAAVIHGAATMLLLSVSPTAAQTSPKPVTIDDLLGLKTASFAEIAPRGDQLAYEVDDRLFVTDIETQAEPRSLGNGSMPRWSPDREWLAFYSTESGSKQLWVVDVASGERRQVTDLDGGIRPNSRTRFSGWVGDAERFAWSPDGRSIAFASQVPLSGEPAETTTASGPRVLVLTGETPPAWTLAGVFAGGEAELASLPPPTASQIFIVDIETRSVTQLTRDSQQYYNPSWSPDGSRIVCGSSEGRGFVGYGSVASNIFEIDVATGATRAITSATEGNRRLPAYSPDGKSIAYVGNQSYALRAESVFLVPADGGKPRNITASLDRPVNAFLWTGDSQGLVLPVSDGVTGWIVRMDVETGDSEKLVETIAYSWTLSIAGSETLAWVETSPTSPSLIRILPTFDTPAQTIIDLNPQVEDWALGSQEIVRWKNSRGHDVEGVLIKPVRYVPRRRYPTIVDVYSMRKHGFQASTLLANQTLAARGYAVFFPNHRAPHMSSNYSKNPEYHEIARGPEGGDILLDDVMSGVDAIIEMGIADPNRLGINGYSNGATAAVYLLTRTRRFKAASAAAGFGDWLRGFFFSSEDPTLATLLGGRTPWTDLKAYTDLSAVYHADEIMTPLLLTVGDKDTGRLLDWIFLYNGLRRLGRNVTLVRYPEEGHVLSGWALKDYWNRMYDFFDDTLKGGRE